MLSFVNISSPSPSPCRRPLWLSLLVVRYLTQGYLMKQGKLTSGWSRGYFRLDDGLLAYYVNKSLVGTKPKKVPAGSNIGGEYNSDDSRLAWPSTFAALGKVIL